MNYVQALEHLHAIGPELAASTAAGLISSAPRRKFDLDHMCRLCKALGNPQHRVPSILIAGTNGKGSTAATLASILNSAGYRTGLYTSPHLSRVNERIQISRPIEPSEYGSQTLHGADGPLVLSTIADEDFARIYTLVDDACERLVSAQELPCLPSFFERLTAIAFTYFAGTDDDAVPQRAEVMVLEVGMGGRLDATNVVEPLISVITDIALDHQDYLGDTIAKIAREKAGILRQSGTLVTLSQHPEANQAIGDVALSLQVRAINAAEYLPPSQRNGNEVLPEDWKAILQNRYTLLIDDAGSRIKVEVDSPLAGSHQQRNIALALCTAVELRDSHDFKIPVAALLDGVHRTVWPGRLEFFEPNLLLDVAHNPAGAWTLRNMIASLPADKPRTLIFSCLGDKDLEEMSRILFPLFDCSESGEPSRRGDHIILAPVQNPRATSIERLLSASINLGIPAHASPHLSAALAQAREMTPDHGVIIATGSIYLVGELRATLLREPKVSNR